MKLKILLASTFFILIAITSYLVFTFQKSTCFANENLTSERFEEESLAEKKVIAEENIGNMIAYLDTVSFGVANSERMSLVDKTAIETEVMERKTWLLGKKDEMLIEDSLDEMKTLGDEVEAYWNEVHIRYYYWNGRLLQARIEHVHLQFSGMVNFLESEIQGSEQDVSNVSSALVKAKVKLSELDNKKAQSLAKFNEITPQSNASMLLTQGKQYIREAQTTAFALKDDLESAVYYLEN